LENDGVMRSENANQKYDRDFLLSPEKRNQIVELWEVEKYGADGNDSYYF